MPSNQSFDWWTRHALSKPANVFVRHYCILTASKYTNTDDRRTERRSAAWHANKWIWLHWESIGRQNGCDGEKLFQWAHIWFIQYFVCVWADIIGVSCASSAIFLLHSGDVSFGSAIVVREFVCVGWMWWWYFYYILPIWYIVYMNSTNSQHVNYAKFFSTKNKLFLFANVPCPCIFHMLNCVRFLYTSEQ